jgi:tetratricopeptide (TPR) repeat protein
MPGTIPTYRDSGDLIAAGTTLGIAHPPGYPVYVLFTRVLSAGMPWGNRAYRVNFGSVLATSLAALLLWTALRRREAAIEKQLVAAAAALVFVARPAVLALGRVAEMYALAALVAAGILWTASQGLRLRPLGWFLFAVGLGVHPSLLFLFPLLFAAPHDDQSPRTPPQTFVLALLLGVTIFLFLPLRAGVDPWCNWGDPSTWRQFWRVVTRADYGGLKLHPEQSLLHWTPEGIGTQLSTFAQTLWREWKGWGVLVGLAGLMRGFRRPEERGYSVPLFAAWLPAGPLFFVIANLPPTAETTPAILQTAMVVVNLLWTPFVAAGALWIIRFFPARVVTVVSWGLFVGALALLGLAAAQASRRDDFLAYDYARNLVRSLPPNAVLFDPDDTASFSLRALQATSNRGNGILPLNFFRTRWGYAQLRRRAPELLPPYPIESAQELEATFWAYSAQRRPFFVELPQKLGARLYRAQGLVYRVGDSREGLLGESIFDLYHERGPFRTTDQPDFFAKHLLGYYAAAHTNFGMEAAARQDWTTAIRHYHHALVIDPDLAAAYNNWGVVLHSQGRYLEAVRLFQAAVDRAAGVSSFKENLAMALNASKNRSN